MGNNGGRRRRWIRWTAYGLGATATILMLPIVAFWIAFRIGGIRSHQMEPPAALLREIAPPAGAPVNSTGAGAAYAIPASYADLAASTADPRGSIWLRLEEAENGKGPLGRLEELSWKTFDAGGALQPAEREWLEVNRETIETLLALADAGGLPPMPREWIPGVVDWQEWMKLPAPNYLALRWGARALVLESRRLREAGDETGAARALLAVLPIAESVREAAPMADQWSLELQDVFHKELVRWIESDAVPSPAVAAQLLAGMEGKGVTLEKAREFFERKYLFERSMLADVLDDSFLEQLRRQMGEGHPEVHVKLDARSVIDNIKQAPLASLQIMGGAARRAALLKSHAGAALESYDDWWKRQMDFIEQRDYLESDFPDMLEGNFIPLFGYMMLPMTAGRIDAMETEMDLLRAALQRLAGLNGIELSQDLFTEKPVCVIEESDGDAIFYSVGPDRNDDGAALKYDPTNGTFSAGDIVVRVRGKR